LSKEKKDDHYHTVEITIEGIGTFTVKTSEPKHPK